MKLMSKKKVIILIVFILISILVIFLRETFIVTSVTSFFQNMFSSTRANIFSETVKDERELMQENRKLKEMLSEMHNLERENIALRSQFEDSNYGKYKLLPAKIMGYKGRGVYDYFIINAGVNQGVKNGMAVIVGNTLVGTVQNASSNISEVRTVLHSDFSTIVKYPKTNARGIIRGFNSFLILENVLITDSLEKDGILVTMGELNNSGIGVPSDINVGKINSIEKIETASFQTAQVEPLIDYSQISNVFIILGM